MWPFDFKNAPEYRVRRVSLPLEQWKHCRGWTTEPQGVEGDLSKASSPWSIRVLANEHCSIGENPVWDEVRQSVYWTDIPNGKLFRYEALTGNHELIYSGEPVGGFCLQEDGSLLLFRVRDIAVLQLGEGDARSIIQYTDSGMERFNDVLAGPDGRVYAGTIGKDHLSGGLYRVDIDGSVTKILYGTGCANGAAITADLKTFFWTDSTQRRILRYDFDAAAGALSNERLFLATPEEEGIPDGLCIDAEGNLWSARWGGATVAKIDADGRETDRIKMPVNTVSCPCFGGERLDRLYVTTADGAPDKDTWDGALFEIAGPLCGLLPFRSRILL